MIMSSNFNKIVHFTRLVKTEGRLREFNFRKNISAGENTYDVDTADDRGNRLFFRLIKDGTEWSLTYKQPLPEWITRNQEQLVAELEQGLVEN